jgi:DNA polymerase alpha subunit A
MQQRGLHIQPGQEVQYVIVKEGASGAGVGSSVAERARALDEVTSVLDLDLQWYKLQQLHPPITRLLVTVEEADPAMIADCLGIDGSKFKLTAPEVMDQGQGEHLCQDLPLEEVYADIYQALLFKDVAARPSCSTCKQPLDLLKVLHSPAPCPTCSAQGKVPDALVTTVVAQAIASVQGLAHEGWGVCDEPTCGRRSRNIGCHSLGSLCMAGGGLRSGRRCGGTVHPEVPPRTVHRALLMLREGCVRGSRPCAQHLVDHHLSWCSYHWLNTSFLADIYKYGVMGGG